MLTTGQLLAERYRLGRRIAVGGMGEVWEAVDVRLDRTVAVKVLKAELCGDAEFLHRFRTEARTTASLNHPGIAAVHDYGETAAVPDGPEDTAYLVMELVEGEPLAAILARERRINTDHTMDMLEQAGQALQAAHERGLVHRDVKPGNILITPEGKVKLTDFGIAKAADAAPVTRNGMVMGTAHYIAPEQALGSDATPASDVYSLAVVGYECLMGHRPFLSENAVTVAMMHIRDIAPPLPPDVPPGVRALVEATLVKDPRRRYADGGEFASAVAAVRAGRPLPTPSALVAQQQRPVNVHGPGTGVHPAPPGPPPMGNTYPPGIIPPQQPVQQQAVQQHQVSQQQAPMPVPANASAVAGAMGGNAHRESGNTRVVVWILVAALAVVLLVAIGLLTYWAVNRHDLGMSGRGPVATLSLDSTNGLGQTSQRQEPMIGMPPAGEMGRSLTRIGTTIR
ncbi:serine/threonine-protein kinase [Saccharopolyspora sp. NPDC049426]|uniref:serine/threonine-protein kinase n=1 Tax=Saccharopolyspora sp. NPDC049426 TaxID=3155652 RepID=UPI00344A0FB4